MLECEITQDRDIATVLLKKPRFGFLVGTTLQDGLSILERMAPKGVLFDASQLPRATHGMLSALLEAILHLERARAFRSFAQAIAVCGLQDRALVRAKNIGLERIVPMFANVQLALTHERFRSLQLCGVRSVVPVSYTHLTLPTKA